MSIITVDFTDLSATEINNFKAAYAENVGKAAASVTEEDLGNYLLAIVKKKILRVTTRSSIITAKDSAESDFNTANPNFTK